MSGALDAPGGPIDIEIVEASEGDKSVLRNLLQFYIHDLSEFEGFDVDPHGLYWYRWLDHYWTDDTRHPFLVRIDGRWAGFALVNESVQFSDARFSMAEFFIMRKYRRQGVGSRVAADIIGRFPGKWEIRQSAGNSAATTFWRGVASSLSTSFEDLVADRPVQVFETRE